MIEHCGSSDVLERPVAPIILFHHHRILLFEGTLEITSFRVPRLQYASTSSEELLKPRLPLLPQRFWVSRWGGWGQEFAFLVVPRWCWHCQSQEPLRGAAVLESPFFQPTPENLNIPGAGLRPKPGRAVREGRKWWFLQAWGQLKGWWVGRPQCSSGVFTGKANSTTHVLKTAVA